jgi:A/G-specific adenine glycosylase
MDLGALACYPKRPDCSRCPIDSLCESRRLGVENERPVAARRKPAKSLAVAVGVLVHEGRVLIQKRPPDGLMPHLWEFPGGKIEEGETPEQALEREFLEELELQVRCLDRITLIRHSYTSFRVSMHAFHCGFKGEGKDPVLRAAVEFRWVRPEELDSYAFPAANRKLIELLTP